MEQKYETRNDIENMLEMSDEAEQNGITLQHSHRLFMSAEMSLNAKKFAEAAPPLPSATVAEAQSDSVLSTDSSKEFKQEKGGISSIRNMTFFGSSRVPDGGDNRGGISAIRNLTFFGATSGDGDGRGGITVMRNITFLRKRDDNPSADVERKGISAVRNMTFLLRKPGEDNKKTFARRSMSMGYARPSARPRSKGDGEKIIVGRNLTTRRLSFSEPDEIDHEVHKVLSDNLQCVSQSFGEVSGGATEATTADDTVIVCGPRLSSIYIGTASLFPLSTIPVSEELQLDLNFDSFLRPEHITDGSNSCIYSARNTGVLASGPQRVVLKVLNEDLDDVCTAKREFDFERDILAAVR